LGAPIISITYEQFLVTYFDFVQHLANKRVTTEANAAGRYGFSGSGLDIATRMITSL
jgi:hypothetical protein